MLSPFHGCNRVVFATDDEFGAHQKAARQRLPDRSLVGGGGRGEGVRRRRRAVAPQHFERQPLAVNDVFADLLFAAEHRPHRAVAGTLEQNLLGPVDVMLAREVPLRLEFGIGFEHVAEIPG